MTKIAIVGSRKFSDLGSVKDLVWDLAKNHIPVSIVSGGAIGVDQLAAECGQMQGLNVEVLIPDWDAYGRAAGPIRNQLIVDACDEMHAFWDGKSRGTKNAITLCERAGKPLTIHSVKEDS